jgi:hypothetical protein
MGSWSVYCGISNISITAGHDCVLLPLKKGTYSTYLPYLPATLPIFGEYDDYGRIENIKEDANTKLIEEHFGISIDEFAQMLIDGPNSNNREEAEEITQKMQNYEEVKEWTYMWIDRKVYNFLSGYAHSGFNGSGNLPFGKKWLLELLGFKYIGENLENPTYDPKRYKYQWNYKNRKFFSDGTWLYCGKEAIYDWNDEYSSLIKYADIPEELQWIGKMAQWQMWEYMPEKEAKEELLWIVGVDRHSAMIDDLEEMIALYKLANVEIPQRSSPKTLLAKYVANYKTYGKLLCELVTIRKNIFCMSGRFEPYILYITPQCGEPQEHQKILKKFVQINRSYCKEKE